MPATLPAEDNQLAPGCLLTSGSSNYQVQSFVGQGAFGKVVKCQRLDDKRTVAIKMIKQQGFYATMADQEVATLKKLRLLDQNKCNLVQWYRDFSDRGHICLEFEHLDKSLLDFMKERYFRPLLLKEIRPIVQQIAHALNHLKAAGIVHADLKLDNVMLVDHHREPFRVKVIDFGLACEVSAGKLGSYIQTRPYRSPEIMLGYSFTEAIDMWSLGCMSAAMYLGTLLYPGMGEYEMIKFIMDTQGQLPDTMLNHGRKTHRFFNREVTSTNSVWKLKTPEEYLKETGKQPIENRSFKFTSLDDLLHIGRIYHYNSADKIAETNDMLMFVDILKRMLQLDPDRRFTPRQVLEHNFISMRHIASMVHHSNHVKSCFQMMEICQKQIQTSDSRTAVCGSVEQPPCTAINPVQHHQTNLHPYTTTQTRGPDGSRKRKNDHEDVPPYKRYSLPMSNSNGRFQENCDYNSRREYERNRGRDNFAGRSTCSYRHDSWHTRHHQSDQRTRPVDHHHYLHTTGPTGSSLSESQAQSGLKRQGGDHEDVPPHKTSSLPWSDSNRSFQGNCDYNSRREYERNRGRDDFAGRSTCSSRHDSLHTRHHQSDQKTRPVDRHHYLHTTGPTGSSLSESQAQSGLRRQGGDHEDVPPHKRNSLPWSDSNRSFQGNCDYNRGRDDFAGRSTCSSRYDSWHTRHHQSDQMTRPADHHHHSTGPSGSSLTESQTRSGLKRERGEHEDVQPSKRKYFPCSDNASRGGSNETVTTTAGKMRG